MIRTQEQAKRKQILAAARRLFLEHGFKETTTDALAREGGISKQTLYRYYPTKESLLAGVLRDMTVDQVFTAEQPKLPAEATPQDLQQCLRHFTRNALARLLDPRYTALSRLIIAEAGQQPQIADLFRRAVRDPALGQLMELLTEAKRQGLLREGIDLDLVRRMLIGPLFTWMMNALMAGTEAPEQPSAGATAAIVDLLLDGITPR
jgi:TetR/AcrR family transcriptional regulator, mexJK operon transcriptional repressor